MSLVVTLKDRVLHNIQCVRNNSSERLRSISLVSIESQFKIRTTPINYKPNFKNLVATLNGCLLLLNALQMVGFSNMLLVLSLLGGILNIVSIKFKKNLLFLGVLIVDIILFFATGFTYIMDGKVYLPYVWFAASGFTSFAVITRISQIKHE